MIPQNDKWAALARLNHIHDEWRQFTGRAPNGTGETGLLSNDASGWSRMLNEQTEALNLENQLQGKAPMRVRYGGDIGGMPDSIADSPSWWLKGAAQGPFGASEASIPESVNTQYVRRQARKR